MYIHRIVNAMCDSLLLFLYYDCFNKPFVYDLNGLRLKSPVNNVQDCIAYPQNDCSASNCSVCPSCFGKAQGREHPLLKRERSHIYEKTIVVLDTAAKPLSRLWVRAPTASTSSYCTRPLSFPHGPSVHINQGSTQGMIGRRQGGKQGEYE